jgi:hypothetical protein
MHESDQLSEKQIAFHSRESRGQVPSDAVRLGSSCKKHAPNPPAISADDALSSIRERELNHGVGLLFRTDGTVINQDCPIGQRPRLPSTRRLLRLAIVLLMIAPAGGLTLPLMSRDSTLKSRLQKNGAALWHDLRAYLGFEEQVVYQGTISAFETTIRCTLSDDEAAEMADEGDSDDANIRNESALSDAAP